jgi:quercetin dioxygenase-like cupin family protein
MYQHLPGNASFRLISHNPAWEVSLSATVHFLDLSEALHHDERGMVFFPWQGLPETFSRQEMCASLHLITIAPGQVRGQHQHPQKTEWLYVFVGQGRLFWRSPSGATQEQVLDDDRTLVVIPPGIPHALRNEGQSPLYLLAWRAAGPDAGDGPETVAAPISEALG